MNELISIIIPCYNGAKTINRCVQSVLNQSYTNWELIIVDDGSEDDSNALIEQWCRIDERIHLITQVNAGVSVARNNALAIAQGKYICFLDADDWYSDRFLSELHDVIEQDGVDIVCCGYRIENSEGGHNILQKGESDIVTGKDFLRRIFFDPSVRGFVCNKMFQTELLRGKYFPKGVKLCEDMILLCELYTEKIRMTYVNEPLYHYWVDGSGASQTEAILVAQDGGIQILNVFQNIAEKFKFADEKKMVAQMCGEAVVDCIYHSRQLERYNPAVLRKQLRWFHWKYLLSDSSIKKKIQYLISLYLIYKK